MEHALVKQSCTDPDAIALRFKMADKVSTAFRTASNEMVNFNNIVGIEKCNIDRQWLEKETLAISLIAAIASDLTNSATLLYRANNPYSASALVRQLVEIEYLAYTFECDSAEAKKWIQSTQQQRQEFFKPAKLRKAAGERFRSKDYGYHCELGGHPVPDSLILLNNEDNIAQLMLSDMISHSWRIWDHLVNWAMKKYDNHPILRCALGLIEDFEYWENNDILTKLPSPP